MSKQALNLKLGQWVTLLLMTYCHTTEEIGVTFWTPRTHMEGQTHLEAEILI